MNKTGEIIIKSRVNVKPWEMHSAIVIAKKGYNVKFIPSHNSLRSADAFINNTVFEFKSPEGSTIKCIENNTNMSEVLLRKVKLPRCGSGCVRVADLFK